MTRSNLCFIKIFAAEEEGWIKGDRRDKNEVDHEVIVIIQLRDKTENGGKGQMEGSAIYVQVE